MADKPKAERPSWNKEEFATKAKEKDQEAYEHAKAAEESLAKGHAPKKQSQYDDLPKPTELLKARTEDLGLTKNLNKTMLVTTSTTGKGPRGAGFYVGYVFPLCHCLLGLGHHWVGHGADTSKPSVNYVIGHLKTALHT